MQIEFSANYLLRTFQDLRRGFLNRHYFLKTAQMTTRDESLNDVVGGLLIFVPTSFTSPQPTFFNGLSRVAI